MSDLYRCECGRLVTLGLDATGHERSGECRTRLLQVVREARTLLENAAALIDNEWGESPADDPIRVWLAQFGPTTQEQEK